MLFLSVLLLSCLFAFWSWVASVGSLLVLFDVCLFSGKPIVRRRCGSRIAHITDVIEARRAGGTARPPMG